MRTLLAVTAILGVFSTSAAMAGPSQDASHGNKGFHSQFGKWDHDDTLDDDLSEAQRAHLLNMVAGSSIPEGGSIMYFYAPGSGKLNPDVTAIDEPRAVALLGLALTAVTVVRRRRR